MKALYVHKIYCGHFSSYKQC